MPFLELRTENPLVYQFYPVFSNSLHFKVKAPHDAHIALTSTPYESKPMYEVIFGGCGNTKSIIRKNQEKPDVVEIPTPNILKAFEYESLWVRWEYGRISAGVDDCNHAMMSWQDNAMFFVQYIGVCTGWGASGHWFIQNLPSFPPFTYPMQEPPTVLANSNIPYLSEAVVPRFNRESISTPKWTPCSNGSVPPKAIIGGVDVGGELIYIARAAHEGALIPGKLVPSHCVAYVAWGGRENPKDSYEVLCDCFARWVPATGPQMPPNAFQGGHSENGEPLYIGRSQHEGSTTPGKIQPSHHTCYIPFGGQEIAKQQYEILTIKTI